MMCLIVFIEFLSELSRESDRKPFYLLASSIATAHLAVIPQFYSSSSDSSVPFAVTFFLEDTLTTIDATEAISATNETIIDSEPLPRMEPDNVA